MVRQLLDLITGRKPEAAQRKCYVPSVTDNVNEVGLGQNLFDVSHVETISRRLVTPAGLAEPSRIGAIKSPDTFRHIERFNGAQCLLKLHAIDICVRP